LSFLRKLNLSSGASFFRALGKNNQSIRGFTLIELLVVILILGILVTMAIIMLNPATQIKKVQDAQRQQDLKQMATALDSYFNDHSSYPQTLSTIVNAKTIQVIPNDPKADSGWTNYAYILDGQNPSQWNVLFARLAVPFSSQASFACPLAQMKDSSGKMCVPTNYLSLGYNHCVISGSVNCDQIVGMTIVPISTTSFPIIDTPTPTPNQFSCPCSAAGWYKNWNIVGLNQCQVKSPSDTTRADSDLYCDTDCINLCTP
jgi:general secretion pathway protein G